jgi:hypothetical protein
VQAKPPVVTVVSPDATVFSDTDQLETVENGIAEARIACSQTVCSCFSAKTFQGWFWSCDLQVTDIKGQTLICSMLSLKTA